MIRPPPRSPLFPSTTLFRSFDTATTNGDPGSGTLRLNAATENGATAAYVNLLDTGGTDWSAELNTFLHSSCTVKWQLLLVNATDATAWMTFDLTSRTTHSGY